MRRSFAGLNLFVRSVTIVFLLGGVLNMSAQEGPFVEFVRHRIGNEYGRESKTKMRLESICQIQKDKLARRVFFEYGAMFAAARDVRIPPSCIFSSAAEVVSFQQKLITSRHMFGVVEIELQEKAMRQLLGAVEEAARLRLSITPLDGSVAGRRSYDDTVRIWNSRFYRALDHWVRKRRITADEADEARTADSRGQIERVIAWEEKQIYFSTDFSKSIFFSVAPPGTSQHLSMLAFDVVEAGNPRVRAILNRYGWFQTIRTDQPHFTFLGADEAELPKRGLMRLQHRGNTYWIPSRSSPASVEENAIGL